MAIKEVHNAIVTRIEDDDKGVALRGAVFFEAKSLFDGEFPLPAEPCFPYASADGAGMFWVPSVGDEIEVEVLADDGTDDTSDIELPEPRYRCMVYSQVADIDDEFKTNYTKRMGWKTPTGHFLLFDFSDETPFISLKSSKGHELLFDDKDDKLQILTAGGHKFTLDDKTGEIVIEHSGGTKILIDASKITAEATDEIFLNSGLIKLGSSPGFHATLSENVIGLHDVHIHPPHPPLVGGPILPPVVTMASMAGTPLDPTALKILLKGNT